MIHRDTLERRQLWLYLAAILAGLGCGAILPATMAGLEPLLWPLLALLLFATFTQVALLRLGAAFGDLRLVGAALAGNFLLLPLLVWGLLALLPADPGLRLGLALVLLVPCTDWFITFAQQAGGDGRAAVALTPLLLVAQILLLPLYLWLMLGEAAMALVPTAAMAEAFVVVIVLPLLAALGLEVWAAARPRRQAQVTRLGWLPVPLLALVLFLIAASQVEVVLGGVALVPRIVPLALAFLVGGTLIGLVLARMARLAAAPARTLVFTLTTRNSFVVLPLALALPAGWEAAALVIVLQSLVELFGMLALLWLVPRLLP